MAELTQAEFARWAGYTKTAVRDWVKAGLPHTRAGKNVVIETTEAIPWLISKARNEKVETAASERAKLDAERRRALKRENDIADGDLVRRDEVIASFRATSRKIVSALEAVPARLAGRLADIDDPAEIARILKAEIREARGAVSEYADAG